MGKKNNYSYPVQLWNHLKILSKEKMQCILRVSAQQCQEPTRKRASVRKEEEERTSFFFIFQVWWKLLCEGQISNGYMVESKYLTSVYISDSNVQKLLPQQSTWEIFLVPELSSKKCLLNKYKLTTCHGYQFSISGTDAQPRNLHCPSVSISEMLSKAHPRGIAQFSHH